ncbi:DUF4232 domain-containing protein [Streptomyces sp. AM 2-1-1]|uniref:DUF4232 domain-containing protein n=1 Tax=Streptomyces sp. AM 2-1-1 TaxID=3028709 RepID=UPI0023B9488E|nr:DUF4232 domain-containing protein [Streptomyces sp. AM 2-1-1]WEH40362.1 DUF4232 domain-containing protein [Streptomyces sp. AM 2-1-1]
MRHLRVRRSTRIPVLGVAALVGALTLTGCTDEDTAAVDQAVSSAQDAAADGAAAPATTHAPSPAPAAQGDKGSPQERSSASSGSKSGSASGSGSDSASGRSNGSADAAGSSGGTSDDSPGSDDGSDSATRTTCDGSTSKVKASILSRPVNHVLLTITNTGSTACDAYAYPGVGYDGAQAVMDHVRESVPQSVVSLEPGQSAYASVRTSSADGSGEGGADVSAFTVDFQDASGSFGNTTQTIAPLGKGVWVDSSAAVTYWLTDFDAATSY